MVNPMGKPGRSFARGLICTLVLVMLLGSSFILSPPASAAPGDLVAPVYVDGDWWNHTWNGDHTVPAKAGDYDIEFSTVNGWLKHTVDGTTSYLGKVAWVMKVSGKVRLQGDWSSGDDQGSTTLEAQVGGKEYRSTDDLALLGSTLSYSGDLEIATKSGPEDFDVVIWENRTLDRPMRMLLFPVPIATFPSETHTVTQRCTFEVGTFAAQRVERWQYRSTYKGLGEVQGKDITFTNQHTFTIEGNVTVDEEQTAIDLNIYYENNPRKAVTVDQSRDMEVGTYEVSAATGYPDLVVADGEFNVTDENPTEGVEVNFTATIHNIGAMDVLAVVVELWAAQDDGRPSRENSTTVSKILPNDLVMIHFNWTAEEVGQWEFFLRVDPTNIVTENREDNNEASLIMVVSHEVPKANLYVVEDGISLDPPSPVNNRTALQITITVGNDGPGDANNVSIDLYLGEPGKGGIKIGWREIIDDIPSGQSRKAWINWGANVPGNLELWVYLDSNNTVNETVETDNLASIPLIVVDNIQGEVDLVVAAIKMVDSNGLERQPFPKGEQVTIRVTASNVEDNEASRVHMSVYVDTEDPQGLIGSHDGSIGGKGLVTWTITWIVDRDDGVYNLIVTLLAVGDVDARYKDNEDNMTFVVGPRSYPNPEPLEITIFPERTIVSAGSLIQVSGKVTLAKNGFEVPGATVYVQIRGQDNPVEVTTNNLGRYLANVSVPDKAGTYRLEAQVRQGLSEGDNAISITVQKATTNPNNGGSDDGLSLSYFVISLIVVLAVVMPLTYYILVTRAEIRRRVRHVHEEIVEIVEEDK
jgi:hypothetical protein